MSISNKDKEIIESAELQRQFCLSQFDTVVNQLLNSLAIQSNICLESLYCQIKAKNGKVVGKDILKLINLFKQQFELQQQIEKEIKFYKGKIAQIADTGKINLTAAEFFQQFTLNNPSKSIVTQQIQDQISEYKSISVASLSNLIQKVQQSQNINCINRKSTKIHEIHEHETHHTELSEVFNNQFVETAKLIAILQDSITNPQLLVKLQGIIQTLNQKLKEKSQLIDDHQEHINRMERREKKAHQQICRLQSQIQEKDHLIYKLHEQNELYEQEIEMFERKCQEDFIETISKLNEENIRLLKEKQQTLVLCQKLEKQLEWVNINYKGIAKQYQKFAITRESEKKEEKLEPKNEHQMADILKQELREAYEKINKLRKLNMQLQTKVMDLQTELECKAIASNPLTDRTFNNLALDERVPNYAIEDPKETFLQLLRKNSCNQQFQFQESLSNGLKQQRCNSIRLIKSITKQFFLSQKKPLANNYSTNQTNKTNFHLLPPTKPINLKHSLRQYDFAGLLDSEILKPVTNVIESFNTLNPIQPIFSSQVWIMQPHGPQQKFILLLTSARLVLCRANYSSIAESFHTVAILEFCFCQNMRTWFVVKFKEGVVNLKGKIVKQFVIQIKNRSELIKYLFKNGFLSAENQINLTFKSEQQILVNYKQRVMSLSSFAETANLIDRSINDGENVFEATINENSSFFFRNITVVIVINSVGILIFDKNKNKIATTFQQKPKFKNLLPFCESQEIIDLSQNKKIKLVYPSTKRSYTLQFCSYAEAKLAESKIKIQKQNLVTQRAKQDAKSVSIFSALRKMRSIQGSGDLCASL